ncbi:hypothetical protein FGO68_gene15875 [Halteria grandinella]|uniref:Transmembrane protein n=1 Tax=Halteria grandinella TaxID=5974 RepID=A0A8J8P2I1_HALGN|nr:hypothetical protein FGO68_gene15875 [Halteria grandinella]
MTQAMLLSRNRFLSMKQIVGILYITSQFALNFMFQILIAPHQIIQRFLSIFKLYVLVVFKFYLKVYYSIFDQDSFIQGKPSLALSSFLEPRRTQCLLQLNLTNFLIFLSNKYFIGQYICFLQLRLAYF